MSRHETWDELAAGYALSALEPEEERAFVDHLAACDTCVRGLADHTFVAAQLGTLSELGDGPAPTWDQIRPGVLDVPSLDQARAARVSRTRSSSRLLAAAAAVALFAGGSVLAWQVTRPAAPSSVQTAIAACQEEARCQVVRLQSQGASSAIVLVREGTVRLLPTALPAPKTGQRYVLWQLPRDGKPTMVSPLPDFTAGTVGAAHPIVHPLWNTAAFALSLERADVLPQRPSAVVAVGSA